MAERGWETDAAVGGVMGRWAAIVGPEVSAHAVPLAFEDGELVVGADVLMDRQADLPEVVGA